MSDTLLLRGAKRRLQSNDLLALSLKRVRESRALLASSRLLIVRQRRAPT